MAKTVTALFKSRAAAGEAVDRLLEAGFAESDVSVLMSEKTRGREFGIEESTKAPEGAATGGVIGGALGAIAAGLVALGVIAAPGLGLVAAGPIVAALAGAGAGAAVGGLTGALIGMGVSEHEARLYSGEIERGQLLVGVYTHDDRADAAEDLLKMTGGTHVRA